MARPLLSLVLGGLASLSSPAIVDARASTDPRAQLPPGELAPAPSTTPALAPMVIHECFPGTWLGPAPPPPPPVPATGTGTGTTQSGQVLTKEFLSRIPSGRSYQEVVQQVPGVTSTSVSGGRGASSGSRPSGQSPDLVQRPPARAASWGGTIQLSNDDSMSMASPQRVLWSLERHAPVPLDQLRPHEFLNWFAFRHEAPAPDAPFAIHGEARELEGSTLSLALAVTATEGRRRPLDLTLILDRSGSMQESGRLDYLKRGLLLAADRLQPGDRVDMVVFDGSVCTPVEGWVVGRDDPTLLRRAIEAISPTGSTNLAAGLREGYRVARAHLAADPPGVPRNRRAMLVTDALLNTGDVDEALVSDIGAAFEEGGIRLTGVGVGREFNDSMLDRLTEKGHGVYVFMGSVPSVDRIFGEGFDRLTRTVAEDVRIALSLPRSLGMQRFYGEEMSVDPADVQPVNVQAGATQLFLEDLRFRGGAPDPAAPLQVDIAWTDPDTGERSAWRWASTVGEVLANGSANVDKGRALMAFTDMIVEDGVSGGYCKAARAELLRRAEVAHDPDVDRLVTLAGDRCTRAPVAWRDPYTEARALQAPAGMISLCAAPPPPATAFGVSRFAPPTFASPRSGCGPSAELGPIR